MALLARIFIWALGLCGAGLVVLTVVLFVGAATQTSDNSGVGGLVVLIGIPMGIVGLLLVGFAVALVGPVRRLEERSIRNLLRRPDGDQSAGGDESAP